MNRYEELEDQARGLGLSVREKPLQYNDGRIKGRQVLIRSTLPTTTEKASVLAEELGHHLTAVGDILDQGDAWNRKKELQGRAWAYNRLIGLSGIVRAYKAGCRNAYEMAELLGVTEEMLVDALAYYRGKYGVCARMQDYVIYFEPLGVIEKK